MTKDQYNSVTFDPGFSKHYPVLDELIMEFNSIGNIKSINQRKFRLQMLETNLIKPFSTLSSIYYGCVIYGSILSAKYGSKAIAVTDNPIAAMNEEARNQLDLSLEPKQMLELYHNVSKSIQFHLKRKSRLPENIIENAAVYTEFIIANNHFKDLKTTDQIKLTSKTTHFNNYTPQQLDELEKEVHKIANEGDLSRIFNIS